MKTKSERVFIMFTKEKIVKRQNLLLIVLSILTVIKSVFTEYGYDASYHIALSWRHINGDRLLGEMWEPHQTSSFALDALMMIYRVFIPSMTGVALYLQVMGAIIYGFVVLILYKCIYKRIDKRIAVAIASILLVARPKGMTLIEFSNLLIIASILLLISLMRFYDEKKLLYCIYAGVATCILILAYPTGIIIIVPVTIIVMRQNKKHGYIYILSCLVIGVTYLINLICLNGLNEVVSNVFNIIAGDMTHGANSTIVAKFELDYAYLVNIIFPLMIIFGLFGKKYLTDWELYFWKCGISISVISFFSVLMLTNLGIFAAFGYLVLGASISIIPIYRILRENGNKVILVICLLIIFTRGLFVINGYTAISGRFIMNAENIIRKGPTIGIVAPLNIVNEASESLDDWKNNVNDEDVVLAVGGWLVDSIVYLYTNAEIANYSTIDTATYSEKLDEYWNIYPRKKATVIAYKSYRGESKPNADEFIGKLIEEKYELSQIGKQWTFYRLRE